MEKLQSDIHALRQRHQDAEENIKTLRQEVMKLESENATMRKLAKSTETGTSWNLATGAPTHVSFNSTVATAGPTPSSKGATTNGYEQGSYQLKVSLLPADNSCLSHILHTRLIACNPLYRCCAMRMLSSRLRA